MHDATRLLAVAAHSPTRRRRPLARSPSPACTCSPSPACLLALACPRPHPLAACPLTLTCPRPRLLACSLLVVTALRRPLTARRPPSPARRPPSPSPTRRVVKGDSVEKDEFVFAVTVARCPLAGSSRVTVWRRTSSSVPSPSPAASSPLPARGVIEGDGVEKDEFVGVDGEGSGCEFKVRAFDGEGAEADPVPIGQVTVKL